MAIYYKGKKVASNRNVNHKDFVDCRDVEFTNPQDGDVPTWDSTAQKLVNKPAHGVFELWENDSPSNSFAGKSLEISSDIQYDALWFEIGQGTNEGVVPRLYSLDKYKTSASTICLYVLSGWGASQYPQLISYSRNVTVTYNSTTHKYTVLFSDGAYMSKRANVNTVADSGTENSVLIPYRIFGVIHND